MRFAAVCALGSRSASSLIAAFTGRLPRVAWLPACLLALVALLGAPARLHAKPSTAPTLTVTNLNDSGAGSLRDAIITANSDSLNDNIVFDSGVSGTIALVTPLPVLTASMTITGPGAGQMTISGENSYQVFSIGNSATVTISGLTIANGYSASCGGGIYVNTSATLTLSNSTVSGNHASRGGGVCNYGTLAVTNSTITENTADSDGGGIENAGTGTTTVTGSTFTGNAANGFGGGIENNTGTLTVTGSTITGNTIVGYGGGINNQYGTLTVTDSTIAGNTSGYYGGGIDSDWSNAPNMTTLINNTITGNTAVYGGGFMMDQSTATLINNTITGNTAPGGVGGGVDNWRDTAGGYLTAANNIISGNFAYNRTPNDLQDASSIPTDDAGGNLIAYYNGAAQTLNGVTLTPEAAELVPLGSYGGPTQTMLPVPGSPAICLGLSINVPASVTTDQRGWPITPVSPAAPVCPAGQVDAGAIQTNYWTISTLADSANVTDLTSCYDGTESDTNTCSLRDAISQANAPSYPDVAFAPSLFLSGSPAVLTPGTIKLGAGSVGDIPLPEITGTLNLMGPGASLLTVSGNNDANVGSILQLTPTAAGYVGEITFANGVENPAVSGANHGGGAIANQGTLTVQNNVFTGNKSEGPSNLDGISGGAIVNAGTMNLLDSTFTGNTSAKFGGAFFNCCVAKATISNSTFTGNTSASDGGAIFAFSTLTVDNSTVVGNTSTAGAGGGINTYCAGATSAINNSIVAGNSANGVANSDDVDYASCGGSGVAPSEQADLIGLPTGVTNASQILGALGASPATAAVPVMMPLPDSPSSPTLGILCQGSASLLPIGVTTDERGFPADPQCSSGAIDLGAAQTNYTQFQTTGYNGVVNQTISPSPTAEVWETNALTDAADGVFGIPVTLMLNGAGTLNGTTTETTAAVTFNGVTDNMAAFGGLSVDTAGSGDSFVPIIASYAPPGGSINANTFNIQSVTVVADPTFLLGMVGAPGQTFAYGSQPAISVRLIDSVTSASVDGYAANITALLDSSNSLTVTGLGGGSGQYSIALPSTPLTFGDHLINVNFAGTSNYGSSGTTINLTATPPALTVTTANDDATAAPGNCLGGGSDNCSLRDAAAAAVGAGQATIGFNVMLPNTISLTTGGVISLSGTTTITGPGDSQLTVDGGSQTQIFNIPSGTVSISGLTLNAGSCTSSNSCFTDVGGGDIYNNGTLNLSHCVISNGESPMGGGIFNWQSGILNVDSCTFTGNHGDDEGGAILDTNVATVINSTFTKNSSDWGGAINVLADGYFEPGAWLTAIQDTFVGNTTQNGVLGQAIVMGGDSIDNESAPVVVLLNNLIPDSIGVGNEQGLFDSGTLIDNGGNDYTGSAIAALANYIGQEQVMPPQPGSSAICNGISSNFGNDAQGNAISSLPALDERGFARPATDAGNTCVDSGAVQTAYTMAFAQSPSDPQYINTAFTPTPEVQLYDQGQAIGLGNAPVTLALSNGGALTGNGPVATASNGMATFGSVEPSAGAQSVHLVASIPVGSYTATADSSSFNIIGVTVSPSTLPDGTVGVSYGQQITASVGTAPYTYSISSGSLPSGLAIAASGANAGLISGTPTWAGTASFTVTATDSQNQSGSLAFTLTVAVPTMMLSPSSLGGGTYGNGYSASVAASGGTAPYTYAVSSGSLPAGLALTQSGANAGQIGGALTGAGAANFTVTATDSSTGSGAPFSTGLSYSMTIGKAPLTVTAASPTITYGQALPAYTASYAGFVNGDPTTVPSSAVSGAPSITSLATANSPAGQYAINAAVGTLSAANYSFNFANGKLTIGQATPLVTVTGNLNPVFASNTVTFTAAVGFQAGVVTTASGPTGTVNFFDGSTELCANAAINTANGTSTCAVSAGLAAGTHSITAVYSGNASFIGPTSSAALTQTVAGFSISGPSTPVIVEPGQAGSFKITLTPQGATSFPAAVNLTVSSNGLPAGATASFSPSATIASGSTTGAATLTIQTAQLSASQTAPSRNGKWPFGPAAGTLALLLLPFARRLRKAARLLLALLAVGLALAGVGGCTSGSGFFGPAAKSYTIAVTGQSGALSNSTNVTLTVE